MDTTSNPIYRIALQVKDGELSLADAEAQVIVSRFDSETIDQSDDAVQSLREQKVELALTLAQLNQAAANALGDELLIGYCAFTLGQIYKRQSKDTAALDCFEDAAIHLESDPSALAQIRLNAAEIKERQNDLEAALQEFAAVLSIAKQLPDAELEVDAYLGLGRVKLAQEKADEAGQAFHDALNLSLLIKDQRGEETARGNLGQVYHFLGNLQEAKKAFTQAISISRGIGHLSGTGRYLNQLGNIWLDLGDLAKADECYREALKIARYTGDQPAEQKCLENQGNLWCEKAWRTKALVERREVLRRAQDFYQDALALARDQHDRRGEADLLLNLGNVYAERKEHAEAQRAYTAALTLVQEQHLLDNEWRIHYAWGKLCDEQNQAHQAHDHYQVAVDIVEQQRKSLKIESRVKFWQERSLLYKRMAVCCLRLDKLWEALEYTERAKSRYLVDLLSQKAADANTRDTVRATLGELPPNAAIVVFNVTEVGTVVFIVTGSMQQDAETLSRDGWQLSLDGDICIQAQMMDGLTRTALQQLLVEVDGAGHQIGGYLFDYHKKHAKWQKETLNWACGKIGAKVLAPIYSQLDRLPIARLILMPNLGLSLLPLHACTFADGGREVCLLDRYEITYAPSFDVLHHCQDLARLKASDDVSLLAVSNPTGDLRYAQSEVEEIRKLLPARILDSSEDNQATREAVMSEAHNYALIHFACHGYFDLNDPLHSALILAEPANLTAEEIFNQLRLPRARLVVMSACETGMVDATDLADEYMGLSASFMYAGAPNVVSSLWAVDDESTALLMKHFYEAYRPHESTHPSRALREAQHWLRTERPEFAHPYYWAAFIVTGVI